MERGTLAGESQTGSRRADFERELNLQIDLRRRGSMRAAAKAQEEYVKALQDQAASKHLLVAQVARTALGAPSPPAAPPTAPLVNPLVTTPTSSRAASSSASIPRSAPPPPLGEETHQAPPVTPPPPPPGSVWSDEEEEVETLALGRAREEVSRYLGSGVPFDDTRDGRTARAACDERE